MLLYLLREKQLNGPALAEMIDYASGMLGISGRSGDMRALHAAHDADADLAIRSFCQSVRKQIAAMIAVLEGIDMLVLTGGIGENDAIVGNAIRQGLGWTGIYPVRTLASLEDEEIALHSARIVAADSPGAI